MKHETNELLLAAAVLNLAAELRLAAMPDFTGTSEQRAREESFWRATNPVWNWIEPAFRQTESVADVIAGLR